MRKKSKAILGIFSALGISSLVAAGCAEPTHGERP